MSDQFIMGAYWKARREPVESCADRLYTFMQTLCEGDDAFAHWYHLGRSRDEARTRKINVQNRPELLALLASGRNRRDTDNKVIENLGFHLWMWNGGEPGKEVNFNVKCGLFSEV